MHGEIPVSDQSTPLIILSFTYYTNFDTFLLQPEKLSVTQIQIMMVEDLAQGQGGKPHSCLCQKY